MGNDLAELMRSSADDGPADDVDVYSVLVRGRRQARRRRTAIVGGFALATAAVLGATALLGAGGEPEVAGQRRTAPPVEGPVVRLDQARPAVEGRDYNVLYSRTDPDLDAAHDWFFSGVTPDGLIAVFGGPDRDRNGEGRHLGLVDPTTDKTTWLPPGRFLDGPAIDLTADRLVFPGRSGPGPSVEVYDRSAQRWKTVTWPTVPRERGPAVATPIGIGPDDRVYLAVSRERDQQPELWSASLVDPSDVRDEGLPAGGADLTDGVLTWTDTEDVYSHDLATGRQTEFDVPGGQRCDMSASGRDGLIVLSQHCDRHADIRDDRVVVLDPTGDPVVTVRGASIVGEVIASDAVLIQSHASGSGRGTYVYDVDARELVKVADDVAPWSAAGPLTDGRFLWDTPADPERDNTFWLGEWNS